MQGGGGGGGEERFSRQRSNRIFVSRAGRSNGLGFSEALGFEAIRNFRIKMAQGYGFMVFRAGLK